MLSSNLSDGEDWIFERVLEAGDPGIVDDTHSIIYDYAGDSIVRTQFKRTGGGHNGRRLFLYGVFKLFLSLFCGKGVRPWDIFSQLPF